MSKVNSVSCYIQELARLGKKKKYVFRGETEIYDHCVPSLFRQTPTMIIRENHERGILEAVRAEKIDEESIELLNAIEAQHMGFPSRLLDVTTNALVALFFAVTPHYTEKIEKDDGLDGRVILFETDKVLSPASETIQDFYKTEILNSNSIYNQVSLFAYQHVLLDHYSKNQRVKSQQGSFILFMGNSHRPINNIFTEEIVIDKSAKKKIREELDRYFGINMGYIYPEASNKVEFLNNRVANFGSLEVYKIKKIVDKVLCEMIDDLWDCVNKAVDCYKAANAKDKWRSIEMFIRIEKKHKTYEQDIEHSIQKLQKLKSKTTIRTNLETIEGKDINTALKILKKNKEIFDEQYLKIKKSMEDTINGKI